MKKSKDNILRYRFTKYVEVSVRRARNHFQKKECIREEMDWEDGWEKERYFDRIFLVPENLRAYFGEQIDGKLWEVLSSLTDRQMVLLYARVFGGLTFKEIEALTGIDRKVAGSAYAYAIKKLRKGVEKE